jgi:mRNA interferase RelE/StbE
MDTYSIEWKASAIHELKRIDHKMVARIIAVIEGLKKNPLPAGVRKLQGSLMTYRVRAGDYRIVYEILALNWSFRLSVSGTAKMPIGSMCKRFPNL